MSTTNIYQTKAYDHAKVRARERFKIFLDVYDYHCICNDIECGVAPFIGNAKGGKRFHWVQVKSVGMIAVYEPRTSVIVTVLNLNMYARCIKNAS